MNSKSPPALPRSDADALWLTDGGIETELIFRHGAELPLFASFVLLGDPAGEAALKAYFEPFFDIARDSDATLMLATPTWRASPGWGAQLGYDDGAVAVANRRAVALIEELHEDLAPDVPLLVDGIIGPRGDGYQPGAMMSTREAEHYHAWQIDVLADAGVAIASALTLNYVEEAIGVARAADARGLPVAISFTVETDGRLPTGQALGEAISQVDHDTGGAPAYYMVNCAHPTHFAHVLEDGGDWTRRIFGVRVNASTMSHAELDESDELDAGDPADLASRCAALRAHLPQLKVLGGCCGTGHQHIAAMGAAVRGSRTTRD